MSFSDEIWQARIARDVIETTQREQAKELIRTLEKGSIKWVHDLTGIPYHLVAEAYAELLDEEVLVRSGTSFIRLANTVEAQTRILDWLRYIEVPETAASIAKFAGVERGQTKKILHELVENGTVVLVGREYSLSSD